MVHLDKLPKLDVRTLQRAGLFDKGRQVPLYVEHIIPFYLTIDESKTHIDVEMLIDNEYYKSNIRVVYSKGGFGRRAFFYCIFAKKICTILYLQRGYFTARSEVAGLSVRNGSPTQRKYSRAAADRSRLMGTDGRGPARGNNRREIMGRLSKSEWAQTEFPDISDQEYRLDRTILKKTLSRKSALKTGVRSTDAAVRGIEEVPFSLVGRRMNLPSIDVRLSKPILSRDHIGNFPIIDLPSLMRFIKLRNWKTCRFTLVWQQEDEEHCYDALMDIRRGSTCGIEIADRASADVLDPKWRVRIWWTPSGRARFICPYTGARVDSLFIREGLLGSRKALNLHYLGRGNDGVLGPQIKSGRRSASTSITRDSDLIAVASQKEAAKVARLKMEMGKALVRRALAGHWPSLRAMLVRMRWGEEFHGIPEIMAEEEKSLFLEELRAAKAAAKREHN